MKDPFFSIIMPIFNTELFLDKSINSVLSQTYQNYELILVDDGSTDGSYKKILEYALKNKKIRILKIKNSGPYLARDAGSKLAKGTHLCFIDSDDEYKHNYLDYLCFLIKKYNPDIIHSSLVSVNGHDIIDYGTNKEEGFLCVDKTEIYKRFIILQNNFCGLWNKCFKREIFLNRQLADGFFHFLRMGDDVITNFEIIRKTNSVFFSTKSFYFYFQNPGSIYHTLNTQSKIYFFFIQGYILNNIESNEYISFEDKNNLFIRTFNAFYDNMNQIFNIEKDNNARAQYIELLISSPYYKNLLKKENKFVLKRIKTKQKIIFVLFVNKCYKTIIFIYKFSKFFKK